jgi:ABC-type Fe3+ transport system substrate-binding protein
MMCIRARRKIIFFAFLFVLALMAGSHVLAASQIPTLQKARQEAKAQAYIFPASHDEILAHAKKEGRLRALSGLDSAVKPLADAFKRKYPFIDSYIEEIEGTDAYQRFMLEMKSGRAKGWDATFIPTDFYPHYTPYMKKFDLLGMAAEGVLGIHPKMVDPLTRNTVSVSTIIQVVAFNKNLLAAEKVPNNWEDFLKPEFKGKKFILDVRPHQMAALVPAWGLERTLEFSRKLAAQQPVWVRGGMRLISAMIAGEYSLFIGPNYSTVRRSQAKDVTGNLAYKIVEPIPTRLVPRADGILSTADHPYAALLWLEYQASPEGQKIIDEHGPYQASVLTSGSTMEKETRGKELSVVDWQHAQRLEEYSAEMVKAYGFPKAEK